MPTCHPRRSKRSAATGKGPRCAIAVALAGVCLVALAVTANAANDPLSDSDLISRVDAVMAVKVPPVDRILGTHKGTPVIVDVRCGDVCPQYTVRIVHYLVEPGPACTQLGGDTAQVMVPISIAMRPQGFCIPHVLYRQKLYVDHPYQK